MTRNVASSAFALSVFASAVVAQLPTAGDKVRITSGIFRGFVGVVSRFHTDTLVISQDGGRFGFDLADIEQLEVSHGQRSYTTLGAWFGAVGGLVLGAVIGSALHDCIPEGGFADLSCLNSDVLPALAGAGVGSVVGGLVGMVIGTSIRTDQWEEVPLTTLRSAGGVWRGRSLRLRVVVGFGGEAEPQATETDRHSAWSTQFKIASTGASDAAA